MENVGSGERYSHFTLMFLQSNGSQHVIAKAFISVSPRNLLQMQILGPPLQTHRNKSWRVEANNLYFNKPSGWFQYTQF